MRHKMVSEIPTDVSFEVGQPDGATIVDIQTHRIILISHISLFEAIMEATFLQRNDFELIFLTYVTYSHFNVCCTYALTRTVIPCSFL